MQRFFQEMDSLMDLMQSQINSAICSAINDTVIPEIQNVIGNLPLNRNGPEPCTSLAEDGIGNAWKNTNTKGTKKDSWYACDLREDSYFTPYKQRHSWRGIEQSLWNDFSIFKPCFVIKVWTNLLGFFSYHKRLPLTLYHFFVYQSLTPFSAQLILVAYSTFLISWVHWTGVTKINRQLFVTNVNLGFELLNSVL